MPKNRGNERVFAVKRLHSPLRDDFDSEFHVLARLNKLITKDQPKHLTVLSATFEIGPPNAPTFYFLFPCADGNLKEFWKRNTDDPQRLTKFSQWMASQLYGLAEAVDVLHNFKVWRTGSDQDSRNRGIHGDIKPENILLFGNWSGCQDKFGMLQLSDFGLTRYHNTQTLNQHSVLLAGIHAYCPPEYELIYDTGQALDVWSLGCLFLEFSVWLVFGSEGLEAFQKDRRAPGIENPNFMKTTFYEIQKLKGSTSSEYCLKTTHSKGVIKVSPNPSMSLRVRRLTEAHRLVD